MIRFYERRGEPAYMGPSDADCRGGNYLVEAWECLAYYSAALDLMTLNCMLDKATIPQFVYGPSLMACKHGAVLCGPSVVAAYDKARRVLRGMAPTMGKLRPLYTPRLA